MRLTRTYRLAFPKNVPKTFVEQVRPVVVETIAVVQRTLPLESEVRVRLMPDASKTVASHIPGSTAWTPDSKHVYIRVNTRTGGWARSLKSTAAHELNHTVRHGRMGTRRGQLTMLDTIAFEGLAQCFEKDVCGERPMSAAPLTARQAGKVWGMIKDNLDSLDESLYRRIFFAGGDEAPTWAGYRISYSIVSRMKKRSGLDWDALMGMSSQEIVSSGSDGLSS